MRTAFTTLLVLLPSLAYSQRPDAESVNHALAAQSFAAPPSVSESSVASPAVEFTTENGDDAVVARIGFATDIEQLAVILKSPLNKVGPATDLLTFDGLSGRASATLSYNRLFWALDLDHDRVREACQYFGKPSNCTTSDIDEDKQAAFNARALGYHGDPWIFGLSVRVGRGDFQWTDLDDFSKNRERHNSWTAAVSLGVLKRFGFVGVRYEYQNAYRGADERNLCRPVGPHDLVECVDTVTEPPSQTKLSIAQLELRRFLAGGRFAINPVFRRDLKAKVSSFEVPLYFFTDKDKKGFTGGASVGWRSDTRDLGFRVFVGATFSLIPFGK